VNDVRCFNGFIFFAIELARKRGIGGFKGKNTLELARMRWNVQTPKSSATSKQPLKS